jgi:hypothetical protein
MRNTREEPGVADPSKRNTEETHQGVEKACRSRPWGRAWREHPCEDETDGPPEGHDCLFFLRLLLDFLFASAAAPSPRIRFDSRVSLPMGTGDNLSGRTSTAPRFPVFSFSGVFSIRALGIGCRFLLPIARVVGRTIGTSSVIRFSNSVASLLPLFLSVIPVNSLHAFRLNRHIQINSLFLANCFGEL